MSRMDAEEVCGLSRGGTAAEGALATDMRCSVASQLNRMDTADTSASSTAAGAVGGGAAAGSAAAVAAAAGGGARVDITGAESFAGPPTMGLIEKEAALAIGNPAAYQIEEISAGRRRIHFPVPEEL